MSNAKAYNKKKFLTAVINARSWRQLALNLGENYSGTTYRVLPRVAKQFGISTRHFKGEGWSKGLEIMEKTLEEILVKGKSRYDACKIVPRLIAAGLKAPICNGCSHDKWLGQDIPLLLSHKNAVQTDYRLENLELLCPNCFRVMLNVKAHHRAGSKITKYSGTYHREKPKKKGSI